MATFSNVVDLLGKKRPGTAAPDGRVDGRRPAHHGGDCGSVQNTWPMGLTMMKLRWMVILVTCGRINRSSDGRETDEVMGSNFHGRDCL